MGFLRDEALRLLREKWQNPTLLAEELYTILNSDLPLNIDGPVTINNPPGSTEPGLTINQEGGGDIAFQINKNNGDGTQSIVQLSYTGDTLVFDGPITDPEDPDADEDNTEEQTPESSGGGSIPCRVVSHIGSGASYQIALYEQGVDLGITQTVTATQLQIAADAEIPEGTWTFANKISRTGGDVFYIQVPVWL